MSGVIYTNEYLRNLPIKMRKDFVKGYITQYENQVLSAARNGKTSYLIIQDSDNCDNNGYNATKRAYQIEQHRISMISQGRSWEATAPTQDEIIEGLKEKFPDCTITYQEKWVDLAPDKKELRKGICVDWSVIKTPNLSV